LYIRFAKNSKNDSLVPPTLKKLVDHYETEGVCITST